MLERGVEMNRVVLIAFASVALLATAIAEPAKPVQKPFVITLTLDNVQSVNGLIQSLNESNYLSARDSYLLIKSIVSQATKQAKENTTAGKHKP